MVGTYNIGLVALSIFIAMLAAYTSLRLAARSQSTHGWMHNMWIVSAAAVLGGGIWSMHFVGMLALTVPGMVISYDPAVTFLSLAIAVGFTGIGFVIAGRGFPSRSRVIVAGASMAAGIVTMHYMGMAGMQMAASLTYSPQWVAVSVLIAFAAATSAIALAKNTRRNRAHLWAAAAMGIAIAGMHYSGMQAASFTMQPGTIKPHGTDNGSTVLAALVSSITLAILAIALAAARLERIFHNMARREARSAIRLEVADRLRAKGTDALPEIAALVGVHFKANRAGFAQLDPVEDVFDYDICWTDGSVSPLFGRMPASAFGVKIVKRLSIGQTIAISDLTLSELSDEAETQSTAREVDTRAILVVPFVRQGQLRTIVYLNSREPREWHSADIEFMEEIAERTRLVIERAEAEQQLLELNATLEQRIEARTNELRSAQEALLQSQKMEAIGQLVSGLAHDFNNVLAAIVSALELIDRRSSDPDKVQKFAKAGLQATDRGARLVSQLLAFSRSQRIQLRPIFVCDVIDDMTDMLARTLGPMIQITYSTNPSPVPVLGDPVQIEMMLLNLAINARDAMPNGGELTIATSVVKVANDSEVADGEYVELSVADTGAGMDETTLRRALEPFFTTKPAGKGTGLGLAQIYGSARQSGGTVRLESRLDEGTKVRVLLPTTDLPVEYSATVESSNQAKGVRYEILLVDDEQSTRQLLADSLRDLEHVVIEAADGKTALTMLANNMVDIALLDFAMPVMNGAVLASHIRQRWPDLPILFASGYSDTNAIEQALGGSALILQKPVKATDVVAAINILLER